MPYKDPERRRQAARKWLQANRGKRAACMRRYRKSHSSGRPPGRPRSHEEPQLHESVVPDRFQPDETRSPGEFGEVSREPTSSGDDFVGRIPENPPGERGGLPPSPGAGIEWEGSSLAARS